MKPLYDIILENSANRELISEYNKAIKWLESIDFFQKQQIITLEDIKKIYDFKEKNKKTAPIVAHYSAPNNFSFRRWVALVPDLSFDVYQTTSFYKGLHNTKLKEDGFWEPDAQDFEVVIAYGFNEKLNPGYIQNIDIAGGQMPENKKQLIVEYYENNKQMIDAITNCIKSASPIGKCPSGSVTQDWVNLGSFKELNHTPNRTPKTDLISTDKKVKISLKKSTGAQLMSGGYCESKATIYSAIDEIQDEDDKKELLEVMGIPWADFRQSKMSVAERRKQNDKDIFKFDDIHRNADKVINKMCSKYSKFKEKILIEATTGNIKFGKNSDQSANYVLLWNDVNLNENKFLDAQKYAIESARKNVKIYINYKSAGKNSWGALRIEPKK